MSILWSLKNRPLYLPSVNSPSLYPSLSMFLHTHFTFSPPLYLLFLLRVNFRHSFSWRDLGNFVTGVCVSKVYHKTSDEYITVLIGLYCPLSGYTCSLFCLMFIVVYLKPQLSRHLFSSLYISIYI